MLSPKRTKFRKQHRGRMRGVASKGNTIAFCQFALQAQDCGWVTARQIEASRRAMTRYIKRGGQIWKRIFPDKPVTMRPAETRMGSGKGNPEFWVAVVKPRRILFEMGGEDITEEIAKEAMRLAQYKLPVKTKFISLNQEVSSQKNSNNILPGFTTATQNSGFPFPEPILVSAGLMVTGLSGKILIQI